MAQCIFCPNPLGSDTKPEHILLNALGGRKTTRTAVCSACNNRFGGTFDDALAEQAQVIRNLLQLASGTGNAPPMLRNVQAGSEKLRIESDGTLKVAGPPFTLEKKDNGDFNIAVRARSAEELRRIIPNLAAATGKSEEDIRALIMAAPVTHVAKRPDPIHFELLFGGLDPLRSVTKACLVLLSTVTGSDVLKGAAYAEARDFVISGGEPFLQTRIAQDARELPADADIAAAHGPIFNLIYVASDEAGRTLAYFVLYNAIAWRIVLAEAGGAPNLAAGLVSNPLQSASWSDRFAQQHAIEFNWLETPNLDYADAKLRLDRVIAQHFERTGKSANSTLVEDVFARHVPEGEVITQEAMDKIVHDLSEGLVYQLLNVPRERRFSADEIAALLKAPKTS